MTEFLPLQISFVVGLSIGLMITVAQIKFRNWDLNWHLAIKFAVIATVIFIWFFQIGTGFMRTMLEIWCFLFGFTMIMVIRVIAENLATVNLWPDDEGNFKCPKCDLNGNINTDTMEFSLTLAINHSHTIFAYVKPGKIQKLHNMALLFYTALLKAFVIGWAVVLLKYAWPFAEKLSTLPGRFFVFDLLDLIARSGSHFTHVYTALFFAWITWFIYRIYLAGKYTPVKLLVRQ